MLRVAARRFSSLTSSPATWKSHQAAASTIASSNFVNRDDSSSSSYSDDLRSVAAAFRASPMFHLPSRGFASDSSLIPKSEDSGIFTIPPTVSAVKNPTSKIVYDHHNHERFPPGINDRLQDIKVMLDNFETICRDNGDVKAIPGDIPDVSFPQLALEQMKSKIEAEAKESEK